MNFEDVIVIVILVVIAASILLYIRKEKKKGSKCIGCPYGSECSGKCNSKK